MHKLQTYRTALLALTIALFSLTISFASWRAQADRNAAAVAPVPASQANATRTRTTAATGGGHAASISPVSANLAALLFAPTFAEAGATLTLTLSAANESVAVVSNGTSYTFTSNNNWMGTDSANVSGNGTLTLTVTTAAFNQINIFDAAGIAGTSVTFNNSGANTYMGNFDIVLDDPGAGTITFNGATSFTGAKTLSASTSRNIVVNSGASVTTADGALTLLANQQVTPTAANFIGV